MRSTLVVLCKSATRACSRTLLPRGQLPQRPNIQLRADVELASSFIQFLLDTLALDLMLLAVLVLALLVTIPNALAGRALLEGITLLSARRTHLGPIFRGGFGFIFLSFRRFAE